MSDNLVMIPVKVVARTDLAILVHDGKSEVWLPKSLIVEEVQEVFQGEPRTVAVCVTEWVMADKGLNPPRTDDRTKDLFGDCHV